jgi:DNA-binding NarL/FixJ family response regulator
MLTTIDDADSVVRSLRAGDTGYRLKDLPSQELAAAVKLAAAGVAQFDPAAAARLAAVLGRSDGRPRCCGWSRAGPRTRRSPSACTCRRAR